MSGGSWSNTALSSLTIPTGATTGARITINVGNDGAILVYDANGDLIASIAPAAGTAADATAYSEGVEAFYPANGYSILLDPTTGQLVISRGGATSTPIVLAPQITAGGSSIARLTSGAPSGGSFNQAQLALHSEDSGAGPARLVGQQDLPAGTSQTGALVQNDDPAGTAPHFLHAGRYAATVSGAGGLAAFAHGAAFTPTFGLITPLTNFSQGNFTDAFGAHGFTATQAQITAYGPSGGFVANGNTVTLYALFMA